MEDSTEKPTNSALVAQGTDETSFLDGSGSSILAQSSLPGHLDGSKGTCIDSTPFQTKQLLIDAQSSQSYLTMTIMTTIMTTKMMTTTMITTTMVITTMMAMTMMITKMTVLIARAAEAPPAI